MSKYSVSVSEIAYDDIASITDYFFYEIKDTSMGLSIADEIFDAISSLGKMPLRHRCFYKEVRAMPVLSYLIFYVVEESSNTVYIARVLHQKQEWEKILAEYL
jgi:toxin ParE1/3/4